MRKIDILANEKFNGDTIKALDYFLDREQSIEQYIPELNKEESLHVLQWTDKIIKQEYNGDMEKFERDVKLDIKLASLNLTESEVAQAEKNPYKAKILKSLLVMLLVEGGIVGLSLVGGLAALPGLGIASQAVVGILALGMSDNIISYFKFRKAKKMIDAENNIEESKGMNL